jgi:hypothetical protein
MTKKLQSSCSRLSFSSATSAAAAVHVSILVSSNREGFLQTSRSLSDGLLKVVITKRTFFITDP